MAENFDNTPIAEATIPVRADLTEFNRSVEDALAEVVRKLDDAASAAAKGFADKVGDALDDVAKKLDALITKADTFKIQAPEAQQTKQEQAQQGGGDTSELRDMGRTLDDIETATGTIITMLDGISARLGNS